MPALALADAARTRWPDLRVSFIGAERGLEAKLLPERGEKTLLLTMHGVKGAGLMQKLRTVAWELPRAVIEIHRSWRSCQPDLLVAVGGYASVSGVVAALLHRVPVVLYEQNAMPGLVSRTVARFCRRIMLGFAEASNHLGASTAYSVTGNIVRDEIARVERQPHETPCLLVLGGSQGAAVLNQVVPEACVQLTREGREFRVVHVAGKDEQARHRAEGAYKGAGINAEVLGFCDNMADFYRQGDLMVARAGAMTVAESAICGMPSLFVPLPHAADDHQRFNAESLAAAGGAEMLLQSSMTVETVAAKLEQLMFESDKLREMSEAAKRWSSPNAKDKQLDVLAEFLPLDGALS